MRKTKIIATLGPASDSPEAIERLLAAGINCFRLNFSHVTQETYEKTAGIIKNIRSLAEQKGRQAAILQDLGGIKLRLGKLPEPLRLSEGDEVVLVSRDAIPEVQSSSPYELPFPHGDILEGLEPGDRVYIADGMVCLVVEQRQGDRAVTYVRNGGEVSSAKGLNIPGARIFRSVLTEKDREDALFGLEHGVDWVGISFVRTGHDVQEARRYLQSIGSNALVMAKIERGEAIDNIDEILSGVDGIMVARGDMGIELPLETVPRVQKALVRKANARGVISVVATQMLLSMVNSPRPTRAEASDISTAVLDGVDAILLSDEVAVGKHPVEAVSVADATISDIETVYPYHQSFANPGETTRSVASAAIDLTRQTGARCIVVTSTGRTAIQASLFRHNEPVLVLSHHQEVLQKLSMVWGLNPVGVVPAERDARNFLEAIVSEAINSGEISENDDKVIIVSGFLPGTGGTTNSIQVVNLAEHLRQT